MIYKCLQYAYADVVLERWTKMVYIFSDKLKIYTICLLPFLPRTVLWNASPFETCQIENALVILILFQI